MAIDVTYKGVQALISDFAAPKRSESAAFLMWYLEHYYRLDPLDATDCVCDQGGDRGVDGIYVNDADQTITIFQSKLKNDSSQKIGEKPLRDFAGTLAQFKTKDDIDEIVKQSGDSLLSRLLSRLSVADKIDDYDVIGEFVVNAEIESNGASFLKTCPTIEFVGASSLINGFISDSRHIISNPPVPFDLSGFEVSEYPVSDDVNAIVAPVLARELVLLNGIENQSIFAFNVRGPLGKTKVNRDIAKSISDPNRHKLFMLFHNGVTIISGHMQRSGDALEVGDYYVVNGCQSLTTLWQNKSQLTDELRVLTKFIKLKPGSVLSDEITQFSNNQNGVKARDFKSNNPIQIRLQNEFINYYSGDYSFEIKTGEASGSGSTIVNETAGVMLIAFDLKEPWSTHRRYEVWEEKHSSLFGRPEVTADRLVLIQVIMEEASRALSHIENELIRKYVLTRYMLLYIVRLVLDDEAPEVVSNPVDYVRDPSKRKGFRAAMNALMNDLAVDFNYEVKSLGDEFDYRGRLRDEEWVKKTANAISASRVKDIGRGKVKKLGEVLQSE